MSLVLRILLSIVLFILLFILPLFFGIGILFYWPSSPPEVDKWIKISVICYLSAGLVFSMIPVSSYFGIRKIFNIGFGILLIIGFIYSIDKQGDNFKIEMENEKNEKLEKVLSEIQLFEPVLESGWERD